MPARAVRSAAADCARQRTAASSTVVTHHEGAIDHGEIGLQPNRAGSPIVAISRTACAVMIAEARWKPFWISAANFTGKREGIAPAETRERLSIVDGLTSSKAAGRTRNLVSPTSAMPSR